MKQHIYMAAILEREGRLFLTRPRPDAAWELPGGPLPPHIDDVDEEMDNILERFGVKAPAIEEDFLQTHYFPVEDGQFVFNLYAATEWTGEPAVPPGHGSGWFSINELEAIEMDEGTRNAVLEAFGLREPEDITADILGALAGGAGHSPSHEPHRRPASSAEARAAGLDVLGTLAGQDPERAAAAMEQREPELAADIIDFALGQVWSSPALDRKTRSLQVVAMLAAQGKTGQPLRSHIGGALNHGATPEQVIETMRMVAVYAGFPAALEAWPAMEAVFEQRGIPRPGSQR